MWKQISQEFCTNNTCPHQQPKWICPRLLFPSLFTIIYDPITEKHFKSGKIQRCFQEYVICDYPEKWPRTKTNSARSYSMQWRKIYYLFFSRKCPYTSCNKNHPRTFKIPVNLLVLAAFLPSEDKGGILAKKSWCFFHTVFPRGINFWILNYSTKFSCIDIFGHLILDHSLRNILFKNIHVHMSIWIELQAKIAITSSLYLW